MKTANEYWKAKFGEYPQNDAEKLAITMMTEYYLDVTKETSKKKPTSFGSLEPLLITEDKKLIAENALFYSNGKAHYHEQWEICYVYSGAGKIIVKYAHGWSVYIVEPGSVIKVPPYTNHWMEVPDGGFLAIMLVYSDEC